jgi:NADPH2:quinone reductase
MPKAIRIHETGGPEVMKWERFDPGKPDEGEALIRQEAVGLNFIDVYHRTGLYPLPGLPAVIGMEGAGVVEAVGKKVTEVEKGDRVAYVGVPGAYAEVRTIPAHRLVKLPDAIDFKTAAAMMLQGMTARYLLHGCYQVKEGDLVLIHAAAGGVGSIAVQWASHLGATVIGTAGSSEKIETVRENGCGHPINYEEEDFVTRVMEITGERGVNAVYDSVGRATFMKSLDCLKPMGMMVSFGQASGKVEPFDITTLAGKGSLFLTRPSLMDYTREREDLLAHAEDLFEVVAEEAVKIRIGRTFKLSEAAEAHEALENRETEGSTVLLP